MEFHELMHGDWLYNSNSTTDDNQYIKWSMKEVTFDASLPLKEYNKLVKENKWFHCGEYFLHNYVQPIEITEDILKLNDFKPIEDYRCAYRLVSDTNLKLYTIDVFLCDGYTLVEIYEETENHGINKCHITTTYVHQLQHALRLTRLNDLADNFKII